MPTLSGHLQERLPIPPWQSSRVLEAAQPLQQLEVPSKGSELCGAYVPGAALLNGPLKHVQVSSRSGGAARLPIPGGAACTSTLENI